MKFLLVAINSKYIHSNPAVYSLKAYAGASYEEELVIKEYTINQRTEEILASIYEENPDYIGFSSYIWNWKTITELLSEIPKILPKVGVFLGGPEVCSKNEEIFERFSNVKALIIGEGEATFKEVVSICHDGNESRLKSVKGLLLADGFTGERESLDMDEVPFFYESESLDGFENRILYYESSRGCPFRCSYCLSAIEKTTRLKDFDIVKKELDFFLRNKVRQVKFIDRTFNANHEHACSIWKYITENDNGVTNFHFEIAADIMTEEEIELISSMRPGLVQLEIGVQSTNEKALKAVNRYADMKHIKEVVEKLLQKHTAHIHLDLIAGLPYEDYESFKKSFNEVFLMHPDQLQLGFLKVLKGAPIEKEAEEFGIKYLSAPPYEVLETKWISYKELVILKKVEQMLETYYNSAQFTKALPFLLDKFDTPFDFFFSLSEYYLKKEYFSKSPARSKRYEILLEFAEEEFGNYVKEELRKELTVDYYLREKPKSKPDFVREIPMNIKFDYEHRNPITYNATIGENT